MERKRMIKIKTELKRKKPEFIRQEGFKHKRLAKVWRRPTGRHSKLRKKEKSRGKHPSVGWGSPAEVRGLNKIGLRSVRITNPKEIDKINPKEECILIAASVGKKKRLEILKAATEKGIKITTK